jgi:hypothetical protein
VVLMFHNIVKTNYPLLDFSLYFVIISYNATEVVTTLKVLWNIYLLCFINDAVLATFIADRGEKYSLMLR